MVTLSLVALSFIEPATPFWMIGVALFILGIGMGNTMAPSTTGIMSSIPPANAGVGSAVGNAARQIGMALGVGILGSVVNSIYTSRVTDAVSGLSVESAAAVKNSVGAAAQVATSIGGPAGDALRASANAAFVDGFGAAMLVGAGIAAVAAIPVAIFMPSGTPSTIRNSTNPTQVSAASANPSPMPGDD
jgi:DHA2 family integral membrane protein (MFS transporter)